MTDLALETNVRHSLPSPASASRSACGQLVRTLASLIDRLEQRERYATRHARDVAALSVKIAARLGLLPDEVRQVRLGALLHDVGKLSVPDGILSKPGPLSTGEWSVMREHPGAGERTLAPLLRHSEAVDEGSVENVLSIVRWHHERWDGRGYPDGLAGDEIPLGARIVAVADAYQAMRERRPYRSALSREDALAELARESGGQFDPTAVALLLAVA